MSPPPPCQFRRSLGGLLAALGMAVHGAGAADPAAPLTPAVAGQVLERVLKLTLGAGKPAVAEWGRVRGAEAELPSWVLPVQAPVLVLEGNAWLVARHADGSFDVVDATLRRRRFQPGGPADRIKGIEAGEWVPVAVALDQPRMEAWLGKIKDDPGRSGEPLRRDAARGRLLFWQALAGAAGGKEAPAKAAELLNGADDRGRVMDTLMEDQAEAAVEAAAGAAVRTGDWKSYTAALEGILTTYTRGWTRRKRVKAWLDQIRPVTAGTAPWLDGVEALTPEQKTRARVVFDRVTALAEPLPPVPWLLPAGPRLESPEPEVREAIAALREDGRALMPAWIALLSDSSLVQGRAPVDTPMDNSYEETSSESWKSLERPVQRREIAEAILAGVMPESQLAPWRKFGGPDKAAAAWWGAYGRETDAGLALIYALHGTGPVQERGMAMVLAGGDEKAITRLEKELLSQVRMESNDYQLTGPREFIALRGRAAGPFVDQLLVALRERLAKEAERYAENDPDGTYRRRVEDWLKGQEGQFRSLLDQRPAGELMADFLSGKLSGPAGLAALQLALQRLPYGDACRLIVDGAVQAPRDSLVWRLLGLLGDPRLVTGSDRAGRQAVFQALRPQAEQLLAAKVAAVPSAMERARFRIRAATWLEFGFNGGRREPWEGLTELARVQEDEVLADAAAQRLLELIEGKPAAPWPVASDVPAHETEQRWKELAGLDPDALSRKLATWKPLELLALEEVEEDWPEALQTVSSRVREVRFGGEKLDAWAVLQGRPVDAAMIKEILKQAHAMAASGRTLVVSLIRDGLRGFRLSVECPVDPRYAQDSAGLVRASQETTVNPAAKPAPWMVLSWQGNNYKLIPWWGEAAPELPDEAVADENEESGGEPETLEGTAGAKPAAPGPEVLRDKAWGAMAGIILTDLANLNELHGMMVEFQLAAGPGSVLPETPGPLDLGIKAFINDPAREE